MWASSMMCSIMWIHMGRCVQELKDRIMRVKKERRLNGGRSSKKGGKDDLLKIYKDIVTFHGEMVLLENYSSLNYTGKIWFSKFVYMYR